MSTRAAVPALLAALVLSGCGPADTTAEPAPSTSPSGTEGGGPQLPSGWRWESFGGLQVGVPGEWGWGNALQRTAQWCISSEEDRAEPVVGRPGPITQVGCQLGGDKGGPAAETLLENTGTVVDLGWAFDLEPGTHHEGDRTTVVVGRVAVAVQAEEAVRKRIAATVHEVEGKDAYGCPVTDPVWSDPGRRPTDPVDVTSLEAVSAVSVCRYAIAQPDARVPGDLMPLVSSLRLDAEAAAEVVSAIAAAPEGGGPDNPEQCSPDYSYGDDVMVLRIESSARESTVHVRYSGCDHNGFDDGVTVRRLTRDGMQPLLAGPNLLMGYSGGPEKSEILQP